MARAVVVGAGPAGLAVAMRLARQRHEVTVLEAADEVGGKLGWVEHEGWGFDTGPSLLTLPAVYRDLFLKTGRRLEDCVELQALDVACRYRFADGTRLDMPTASRGAVREAVDTALGEGTGAAWLALLERGSRIWDLSRGPFLTSPLDGVRTLLPLARRREDLRTVAPLTSLRRLGEQLLPHPHLRTLLDRYATYSGSDPRRAPAALASTVFVEHAFGSWYVRGGLRRLALAMAQRVEDLGGTVRCGTRVEEVLVEGGRTTGVRTAGGERLDAEVVVMAGDAAALYGAGTPDGAALLPDGPVRRRGAARLRRAEPSASGFVLLLALRGRTPDLQHHTVLFPDDYDAEFDALSGTGRHRGRPVPVGDPTVYVSAPDDPATRPHDDAEAWFVLVNAPRHRPGAPSEGVDWDAVGPDGVPLATSYGDHVLDVMARRGLDVRDRVVWRGTRTPADLERLTGSVGGSIYGSSSNGARAAFLRPPNRTGVEGLYCVGGSSHPGGGLPLVGLSAELVAGMVGRAERPRAAAPSA
ncbi:phytoene desaturase family protein [Pseudokineococcus lusitanus]|uniref:Phytoene desaturase n=1 Tax=Pseudokineococcus lusitanus TaxID=763993 RepID=A0A3N1HMA0_9ACTN|nr:phytoene desaturase family protein [Pseudokineococcus lusitanus]ROP43644.1 phytoene desaturase [Pseudokineococcus lusitanus]